MAAGHKFYIFGGGRWREVCTATGRVEGWGRARFVSLRRKRLRLVRRRPLLRALRDLAAGRPSAVRDGPQLSQKRYSSPGAKRSKKDEESVCQHHHCCHRSNKNGCTHIESNTSQLPKVSASTQSECRADAGIQTESSQSHILSFPITLNKQNVKNNKNNGRTVKNNINKRIFTNNLNDKPQKVDRRDTTSSDEILQTKITTTATVHENNERNKHRNRKRKRSESARSVEDLADTKSRAVPRTPSEHKLSLKRKRLPSSSDENLCRTKQGEEGKRLPVPRLHRAGEHWKKSRINPDHEIVMSSIHNVSAERLRSKRHRISNLMKPQSSSTPAERERADSNSSDEITPLKTTRLRSQTERSQCKSNEKQKSSNRDSQSTDSSGSESEVTFSKLKSSKYKPGPKSSKINLKKDKDKISSNRREDDKSFVKQKIVPSTRKIVPSKPPRRRDRFKEIIVEESDVEVLRQYLINHAPDFELLKFDEDNEYKKKYFFKINPLVNVDRCPKIARMLRDESQGTLSLKDFASQLGLASISEISKPKRYNMRRADEKYYGYVSSETDVSIGKENVTVAASNTRSRKDVSKNLSSDSRNSRRILKSPKEVSRNIHERSKKILKGPQNATSDAADTSTDSEHEVFANKENRSHKDVSKNMSPDSGNTKAVLKSSKKLSRNIHERSKKILNEPHNAAIDAADTSTDSEHEVFENNENDLQKSIEEIKKAASKSRHTISKRPSSSLSKEYSNLEDHAVVSWVSVGGRARQVNGNRLWKELEEQYIRLTGIKRTWHSLRNRYLRYILPALGTLALPPSHVARLRAAAATGELKSHKGAPRRNSIFALPPRGALSRRPRRAAPLTPAPANENAEPDSSSDSEPKAKRSRYEESKPSPKRSLRSPSPPSPVPPSPPPRHRRSLRYSEITRQFAARHRADNMSTDSKESPSKRKDKQSEQSPRGRARRLFNPNTIS